MNGLPAQNLIGLVYISPYLFNVTRTTRHNLVVEFNAGALLKSMNQFKHADAFPRSDIVNAAFAANAAAPSGKWAKLPT